MAGSSHELFRTFENQSYPGFRGSGTSYPFPLSIYHEDPSFHKASREIIRKSATEFKISRTVSWDPETYALLPFGYSVDLTAYYPTHRFRRGQNRPTASEFDEKVAQLLGPHPKTLREHHYFDPEWFLEIGWRLSNSIPKDGLDKIRISVRQTEPVTDLSLLTDEIVPRAVGIFNALNPNRAISPSVQQEVVEGAIAANTYLPQCRIGRPS